MKTFWTLAIVGLLAQAATAADDKPANEAEPIKATFLITGLHCPPCTRTVESSLRRIEGVRSVKVDWKTKNARIQLDEGVLPAQKLARMIAETPHMMGSDMQYGGWLALKVPELKDKATAETVKDALKQVDGVKRIAAYPDRQAVAVEFDPDGEATSGDLIEALKEAGFKAGNF